MSEVEDVNQQNGNGPFSIPTIAQFVTTYENLLSFPDLSLEDKKDLWDGTFHFLKLPIKSDQDDFLFITSLRILSRDKCLLDHAFTTEQGQFLLKYAAIQEDELNSTDEKKIFETLKVLFNVVLQSESIRIQLISSGILRDLLVKIDQANSPSFTFQPKHIFWFKILAVLTGHCQNILPKIRVESKGLEILSKFLETLSNRKNLYDGLEVEGLCETLKILYNISHDLQEPPEGSEFYQHQLMITKAIRKILLHPSASPIMEYKINGHAVDLLTAVPTDFLPLLIKDSLEDEHLDFSSINAIICFLKERLENPLNGANSPEGLMPVFVLLVRLARSNRDCRKHLKSVILPPLRKKDVEEMSQVGVTLRNRLVSLFTSHYESVAYLSVSFVFILCKERFGQMIKYTGYGNAAGLFADRGLLFGQKNKNDGVYSDASSDSDTEEYKEIEHMINDVTCRIEEPKPNPMEGLSEEEKEFKAMQLVEVFDRMTKEPGLIRPATIGPDGKPLEIEHVLQLIDGIKPQTREDSDSD